jgi:hypothetical protein
MANNIYLSNYFSMIIQIIFYGIKRGIKQILFDYELNNALANFNRYSIEFIIYLNCKSFFRTLIV